MTCREKLKLELPDCVNAGYFGGCYGCPHNYGYLDRPDDCGEYNCDCNDCWDREIPGTEPLTYEHTSEPIGKVTELTTNDNGLTAKITLIDEKEKNMATTKKTKAELMEELENVKKSKEELEKELKNLEKYKQYEDAAGEIHGLYASFMMAGFSEDQAFELTKTILENADYTPARKPTYRSYR